MANLDSSSLSYYQKFASNNLRFLDDVSKDLEFESSGGTVVYSIDFSELYGYTMGAAETFFFEKGGDPFSDTIGRATLFELHEAILELVLFEQETQYLLLPPYIIELFNFIRRLNHNTVKSVASRTIQVAKSFDDLRNSDDYKTLLDLATSEKATEPNSPENRQFREVFLRAVPDLVDLWRDTSRPKPLHKAKLFLQQSYTQISELLPDLSKPDEGVVAHYYSRLNEIRRGRDNQNFLDAQAMGFIYAANSKLISSKRPSRLVLISRSNVLYDLACEDSSLWSDIGGQPIRHPRSFLNQISNLGTITNRKDASSKASNIKWWKNTYSAISGQPTFEAKNLTKTQIVARSLAVLIDVWKRFCSAQVSSRAIKNEDSTDDILLKALHALNSTGSIRGLFDLIIGDLHQELDKLHFEIPASLESRDELSFVVSRGKSLELKASKSDEDDIGQRVIVSGLHGTNLIYSIHIKSNKIRNLVSEKAANPYDALASLTDAARYSADTDGDLFHVEWYLAMAYLFASISAWPAAKKSNDMARLNLSQLTATRLRERDAQITLFEISYLSSKCNRELGVGYDDLLATVNGLETAIDRIKNFRKITGKNRYLARARTEKIKCIFELIEMNPRAATDLEERLFTCIERCRDNLNRVDDPITEAHFLNNYCYHFVNLGDIFSQEFRAGKMILEFKKFIRISHRVYEDVLNWPENYIDTFCWAAFNLIKEGLMNEGDLGYSRGEILELCQKNASKEFISEHDRKDFTAHARKIRDTWGMKSE